MDQPAASVLTTSSNVFSGWALSRSGVARVELVVDGRQRLPARLGVAREDVKGMHPDYPDNDKAGFEVNVDLGHLPLGHHEVEVVANRQDRRHNGAGQADLRERRVPVNLGRLARRARTSAE